MAIYNDFMNQCGAMTWMIFSKFFEYQLRWELVGIGKNIGLMQLSETCHLAIPFTLELHIKKNGNPYFRKCC